MRKMTFILSALALLAASPAVVMAACTPNTTTDIRCQSGCALRATNDPATLEAALAAAQDAGICAGEYVTVWSSTNTGGGVTQIYHNFTVNVDLPAYTTQLTDEGFEVDHEQRVVRPPSLGASFSWFDVAGWLNGGPQVVYCYDIFCNNGH